MMMESTLAPPIPLLGEACALGASLLWAVSVILFGVFGQGLSSGVANLYKNVIAVVGMLLALPFVARASEPPPISALLTLGLSGLIGIAIGDSAFFNALLRIGAGITSACQCLAPPLGALMAVVFLGERLTTQETAGMLITVIAVAMLIQAGQKPGSNLDQLPRRTVWIGLAWAGVSALCQATGLVLARSALQRVGVLEGTLARVIPAFLALIIVVARFDGRAGLKPLVTSRRRLLGLGAAAVLGTLIGYVLMATASKYAKVGVAGAISSTYPLWVLPLAHLTLRENLRRSGLIWTTTAIGGVILMVI